MGTNPDCLASPAHSHTQLSNHICTIVQTATDWTVSNPWHTYVTDWTVIQASHGLDVQSMTGIRHFLKSSNPSHGLDIQSVTRIGHFLKSSKPSHGLDVQSMTWIGCPISDLDWMSNPWLGLDVQSVTVGCHGLDVQSVTGIGWFLKSSKPNHGLDVQSVTWIGRPIPDSSVSRIGHPIRDWDWMIFKIIQTKSWFGCSIRDLDWTSNPWLGLDDFKKCPIPVTDWTLFKIIQTKSRFGCTICDLVWF